MITSLYYGKNRKERNILEKAEKNLAALLSDDEWKYPGFDKLKDLDAFLSNSPLVDIMSYEVEKGESLAYLEQIRRNYSQLQLLLLANKDLSPMEYLRPSIMANALLLRPYNAEQLNQILRELIVYTLHKRDVHEDKNSFFVETRSGKESIPYDQIYYFEAREKKIYLCTQGEEFGFRGSIETLESELPPQFLRCHRSYIVNRTKIVKVMFAQNNIELMQGFSIPLSRSYKSALKGMV